MGEKSSKKMSSHKMREKKVETGEASRLVNTLTCWENGRRYVLGRA